MPLPNPLATAYVVYESDEKGPFVMVLHYFPVGDVSVDQTLTNALAAQVDLVVGSVLIQCIASDCQYRRSTVLIDSGGVSFTGTGSDSAGNGTETSQSMPDYVAAVIQKRTDSPGRRGRGRWYIGCVPETFNNTGVISTAGNDLYVALGNAAIQDIPLTSGTWRAGHLSRADDTCVPIRAVFCNEFFGTRRKRLVRPGP